MVTWKNILENENPLREQVQRKVFDIDDNIQEISLRYKAPSYSLLSGGCLGVLFFYSYLYKICFSEKLIYKAGKILQKIVSDIANEKIPFSFCNGFAGTYWALTNLRNESLDGFDTLISNDNSLPRLFELGLKEIENNRYDYLHDGLGTCFPALMAVNQKESFRFLEQIVVSLYRIAEINSLECKWRSASNHRFDLGLAHGIPSIIVILSYIYEIGIQQDLCREMLNKAIRWMLRQKLSNGLLSRFPNYVSLKDSVMSFSRLGWCYGDLGIARSLWIAGNILSESEWKEEAIHIMRYSSVRRNLKDNLVMDAGLCHGAVGIAHIFNRFFQDTNIDSFKEAAIYWYKVTLGFSRFNNGIGGYKTLTSFKSERKKWTTCPDFLDGTAGIGLALTAAISEVEPKWDRCLLLS